MTPSASRSPSRRQIASSLPAALLGVLLLPSLASAQPQIDLPPEEPKPAIPKPAAIALPRESGVDVPLSSAPAMTGTGIGGYGEIVLNAPFGGPSGQNTTVDVRRLVLYVGHNFTEKLRLYTELEVEHAVSSSSDKGEFEVEQVFLDYLPRRWFNIRGGLIIMPVGIVNVYHEPPSFNGADRPETDTRVIPSTWREIGAGFFGAVGPLRYQAYAVTGFAALKLDDSKHFAGGFDDEGLREGHQEGQFARAHDWGGVARLDLLPLLWLDIGLAGYYCNSSQGDLDAKVGVGMVEADVKASWKGLQLRAEFANVWIGDTQVLNAARLASMLPGDTFGPVSHQLRGGYVEAGYNVLQQVQSKFSTSLVVFGRYERTNTQADVLGNYTPTPGKDRQLATVGLTLRPIAEIVIKVDYQYVRTDAPATWNQMNAALGFMY